MRPSFNGHPSWLDYRSIVRQEFSIDLPEEIAEHWCRICGHDIRIDEWLPDGEPLGTIVCVHGAGGNGRILAPFAKAFQQAGWRVIAPDLPGYGMTQTVAGHEWTYADWPLVIADLAKVQSGKIVLAGASMGGLTAVYAAQHVQDLAGVIVTTLIDLAEEDTFVQAARWKLLGRLSIFGMKVLPFLLDRLPLPLSAVAPIKAMSANRAMQKYFQTDQFLGRNWLPVKFWRSVHSYRISPIQLDCQLLLVHPGKDDWTPYSVSLQTYDRIGAEKTAVKLSNGSHLPLEQPAYDEMCSAVGSFLEGLSAADL